MHLYNRFTTEQIKLVLSWYTEKKITVHEACIKLGIKERQLRYWVKKFREGNVERAGSKAKPSHRRVSASVDEAIRKELELEKKLIEHHEVPTHSYNYAHVRHEVERKTGNTISAETVRKRAHAWGFYLVRPKREKAHARMILTDRIGVLLQHDSSNHLFAPFSGKKWKLITTLDDYSRKLLFARFVEEETTWEHIMALKSVMLRFGIPANYYVDNHAIFRFVERMESYWRTPRMSHAKVLTAWEQCLKAVGTGVFHALSPQAKGKIERPYRWLQDHIVRRCAKEKILTIEQGQEILNEEVYRYNAKTVHSTTGEIPDLRFSKAVKEKQSAFRPFAVPTPYRAIEDVFCIRELRIVSSYQTIAWRNHFFKVPAYIPVGAEVTLHVIPDKDKPQLRVWYQDKLVDVIFLHPRNQDVLDRALHEEQS